MGSETSLERPIERPKERTPPVYFAVGHSQEPSFDASLQYTSTVPLRFTVNEDDVIQVRTARDIVPARHMVQLKPLPPSTIGRNTNLAGLANQRTGSCYAHAATSAYINTCHRIYGSFRKGTLSYSDCLPFAAYCGGDGGTVVRAVQRLERHFQRGILVQPLPEHMPCDELLRAVLITSVVVSFPGIHETWESIKRGHATTTRTSKNILMEILRREREEPGSKALEQMKEAHDFGRHACLVESYDFKNAEFRAKNSWGSTGSNGHFEFSRYNLTGCKFIQIYFTTSSLRGMYPVPEEEVIWTHERQCSWDVYLTKETAQYSSTWWCEEAEKNNSLTGYYCYKGMEVSKWIYLRKNDPEKLECFCRKSSSACVVSLYPVSGNAKVVDGNVYMTVAALRDKIDPGVDLSFILVSARKCKRIVNLYNRLIDYGVQPHSVVKLHAMPPYQRYHAG